MRYRFDVSNSVTKRRKLEVSFVSLMLIWASGGIDCLKCLRLMDA